MSKNFTFSGNLQFTPADGARDAAIPINLVIPYTQKASDDLVFTSTVTNRAIDLGTMTAPKALYIECYSGSCVVKLATGDTGSLAMGLSATPSSTDKSVLLWTNPTGGSVAMVVTVASAASLLVIAVQ